VAPIFGLMAFGYAATFTRVFDRGAAAALASFVFYFAIPVMMFRNMATTALPEAIAWGYLLSYFLGVAVVFGAGMTIARLCFRGSFERQAIIGFGSAFGNSLLLGVPLVLTTFGERASLPLFLLLAFHSAVMFTGITVIIEAGRGGGEALRAVPLRALKGLLANPILWGMAGGIGFGMLGLQLPDAVDRWAVMLAGAAVPCALFSVGASLRAYRIVGAVRPALVMVALKLVGQPLAVWVLASLVFDVPPLWAKVVILQAALPVGVNVHVFATRYEAGQAESAAAIVISNVLSVLTLPLILLWLGVG
jgi:malonate transporter and related proteins